MTDTLKSVAETLVRYCREGKEQQGLDELYAEDAASYEAQPGPDGGSREFIGLDAIRGKHAWWGENFEVHGLEVDGPYLHGDDRFAVNFGIDATMKASGERSQVKEVAVYRINGAGKIAREEFYMHS